MSAGEWDEISQASQDGRHELHLNGDVISEKLTANNGSFPDLLYKLTGLNYLEISDTVVVSLSDEIGSLSNLIDLALHRNKLSGIPCTLELLSKLKFLDLSFNQLTSFPQICLASVHTLNLSNNQLAQLPDFSGYTCLSTLFIEHNSLTAFPEGLNKLSGFSELNGANNQIASVPNEINEMQTLKSLDLSDNKLQAVAGELSECRKLKTLNLRNNPLKDNRLKKMTVQCNTKAILDYLSKQSSGGGKGKKKKNAHQQQQEEREEKEGVDRKIFIIQNKLDERRVVSSNSVKDERPYICCCVVKQLDLRDPIKFKEFITLQTKLHENECDMRTKATIATHSMNGLKFPLKYEAVGINDISIKALGKAMKTSANELINNMKKERENLKLKKKRNVKTGLYKFLDLVDGKEVLACLKNSEDGEVVSLPPITNSETTKILGTVSDVFIEVTSPISMAQCKYAMEELIKNMFQIPLSSQTEERNGLVLEQIRVVNESGELRVIFPSKVDLEFKGIIVERVADTIS